MALPPIKDGKHSWSVANFESYRTSMTDFLKEKIIPLLEADSVCRILIRAPVKSGKREMVEYLAIRDHSHPPTRVHAFVSAFHRIADASQRDELTRHNLVMFSLTEKKQAEHLLTWIKEHIAAGRKVVLHIDECDFGSGDKQILSAFYHEFRDNPNVSNILYSATPQEVLFSGELAGEAEGMEEIEDDFLNTGERVEYTPPPTFCGPAKFLEGNLIFDAKPFFYKKDDSLVLSEQGKEIVELIKKEAADASSKRNIGILRLSYSDIGGKSSRKENKAIYQFLNGWKTIPELADFLIFVDSDLKKKSLDSDSYITEIIQWSSKTYWDAKTESKPMLVVIDQTSTRSTEWRCHDRVNVYHDYRNILVYSTISQAQERVNHYTGKYNGIFQPIRVYGHKKSFLLSAGKIDYTEYLHLEWKSKKVDKRTSGTEEVYNIINTNTKEKHPSYPSAISKGAADIALQELGCYSDVKVSGRIRGSITPKKIYKSEFYPCIPETFLGLKATLTARFSVDFRNPFVESVAQGLRDGKYKGYLREWSVLDFTPFNI